MVVKEPTALEYPQKAQGLMLAGVMLLATFTCARAQELDPSRAEYLTHCAPCHGEDAKGSGPRSATLKAKPVDLTVLAKKNNGVFLMSAVYAAIDGRNAGQSHGLRDMPIWGCRSSPPPASPNSGRAKVDKSKSYESNLDLACDPEDVIANRILSVLDYLRRVQEQ